MEKYLIKSDKEVVYMTIQIENLFSKRLIELRTNKNVSAREMSLAIGQSNGYINNIEKGNNFPSMQCFFYICEYLGISEKEFFDFEIENPNELTVILEDLKKLDQEQLKHIGAIIKYITN